VVGKKNEHAEYEMDNNFMERENHGGYREYMK
jgi:hypothetical protein